MLDLLQTTRISVNKAENSITLRDTADKVAIAERIVEQNDKQLAEVVVDVELLQINTTKTQDLGVLLSAYQASADLVAPGGNNNFGAKVPDGDFTWDQLKDISIRSFGFSLPSSVAGFLTLPAVSFTVEERAERGAFLGPRRTTEGLQCALNLR